MNFILILLLISINYFYVMEKNKDEELNLICNKSKINFPKILFNNNIFVFCSPIYDKLIPEEKKFKISAICKTRDQAKKLLLKSIPKNLISESIKKRVPFEIEINDKNLVFYPIKDCFFENYSKYTKNFFINGFSENEDLEEKKTYIETRKCFYESIVAESKYENLCLVFTNINDLMLPISHEPLIKFKKNLQHGKKNLIKLDQYEVFFYDLNKNLFFKKIFKLNRYHFFDNASSPFLFYNKMFEFNYKINYLNLKLSINIDFYDKSDKEALVHNQIHEERIKYATEYNEDKINFLKKTPTPLIESIDVDDLFDLKYLF